MPKKPSYHTCAFVFPYLSRTHDELEILLLRMVAQSENITRMGEIIDAGEYPGSMPVYTLPLEYKIQFVLPRL